MKRFLFLFLVCFVPALAQEKPVVLMVGTRPEAIKMLPVYRALQDRGVRTVLCSTGQHEQLLEEVFKLFDVAPDVDFKIMKPNQDLFYITEAVMNKSRELFEELEPALVIVQGDTTSAMSAALAAFYLHIPVAHVEAGLRSYNIERPFPEEMNRRVISMISSLHFAPTELAQFTLELEGLPIENIFCTGNTVVDALYHILDRMKEGHVQPSEFLVEKILRLKAKGKKIVLLTAHRRESFDGGLEEIYRGIKTALTEDPNLFIIYPRHPNPRITEALNKANFDRNIWISPPMQYPDLLYVLNAADGVATDSGGIQEEAVSLNKPTLVLREETDRPEGLVGGLAQLVGTDSLLIAREIGKIKRQDEALSVRGLSPYGDGHASERIAEFIEQYIQGARE